MLIFFLSAADSIEEVKTKNPDASRDENTLLRDFPGITNLKYPNIISKVESADEVLDAPNKPSVITAQAFGSSFSQGGGDQINYGTTILNRCSSQVEYPTAPMICSASSFALIK
jgi:hypothetical protein